MAKKPTYEELAKRVKELENEAFERKQAEEALRESEERYRGFFENSTDFVYTLDLKGNFTDVNKAAESLTGYTKKELIGMNYRDYAAADSHEKIFQAFRRIFEEGEPLQDFPFEVTVKDGAKKYFETSVGPLRKGRKIIGFHGSSRDITHRVHSEQALRQSEERYRTILDSIEEAYFEVDIVGNFTFFNDSMSKILGYSNDELARMNNRDYMPPESSEKIYDLFNQIYNTGNPIKKVVYEIIRKDGGHGFHELSASLMKDQTGRPIGFRGIAHDITDLKKAQDALRESEEKYRNILESIEDGYYELDIAGNFTFCNDSTCRILGWPNNELMGMNNREYMDQETAKNVYQKYNRVYTTGKTDKELQYELTRKDGAKIYVDASVSLMKDAEDQPIGFRGIVRDITERKELEAHLQRAQKMEAIGTLAGGVAHDLNNILSGLVSYPELLLLQLAEDNPLRKSILTIQKSGEKAAAVVQDLLTLARRGVVVTDVVNLNDIISEYLKSPEYEKLQSYHSGVHLETHLATDTLNILGSSTHLYKAVMNLVSNAAEAMPVGGKIIVTTENRYIDRPIRGYDNVKEGAYVVFTISDTGTGISPEDIEKIFEPFYTKKKMGRSGTGLGMAVVWGTVKDHNGYIDIQSTEGKGTTFTLYFPVTRKGLPEDDSHLAIETYRGNGESLLIVDDVEEQRKIASGMLKELGYSVVSVSSGEEAVEYLKTNKVDLLVLDMIMDPGMDGLDTYKNILELHSGQKAIIASGFSETDRVKQVQSLGAGAYIRKPYTLAKIGIAVKEELEK
ncbi:MAG: PAS domain S-box protein [Pseudomonadota bacterium]